MVKDRRYKTIKNLIEGGHISSFREIFDTLPKSVLYKDLGMNNARFNNLLENVELFVLADIFRIADLIEIEKSFLVKLVMTQYQVDNQRKKRASKPGSRRYKRQK